jgi:hypothetical protein
MFDAFLADLPLADLDGPIGVIPTIKTPKGTAVLEMIPLDNMMIIKRLASIHRGAGRAAMEMLVAAADKHRVTLDVTAHPLQTVWHHLYGTPGGKTLTKRKLEQFYAEFGFKPHGYRNNTGHIRMKRQPQ